MAGNRECPLGAAEVIVTMGCGDTCLVITGKWYVDWELADSGLSLISRGHFPQEPSLSGSTLSAQVQILPRYYYYRRPRTGRLRFFCRRLSVAGIGQAAFEQVCQGYGGICLHAGQDVLVCGRREGRC